MKFLYDKVNKLDSYGLPVTLTYNTSMNFTSKIGALISISAKIGILIYLAILITQVVNRTQTTIVAYEYYRDYYSVSPEFVLNQNNFDIATRISFFGDNETIAKKIYTYFQVTYLVTEVEIIQSSENTGFDSNRGYKQNMQQIEAVRCAVNQFGNETVGKGPDYSEYWCPKEIKNLTFTGTLASTNKKFFAMMITPCQQSFLDKNFPGDQCKSMQEIRDIVPYIHTWVAVKTQYFDVEEFEKDPIKSTIKTWVVQTNAASTEKKVFLMSQNQALYQNSLISSSFSEMENRTYYSITLDYSYNILFDLENIQSAMYFLQDEQIKIREKRIFTMVDAFIKIGGAMGLISTICTFISKFIQRRLYIGNLLERFYYFNSQECNGSLSLKQKTTDIRRQNSYEQTPFKFNFIESITICCKRNTNLRKRLYLSGRASLINELDVQSYLEGMRKVQLLIDILLTKTQKRIVPYLIKKPICLHSEANLSKMPTGGLYYQTVIKDLITQKGNKISQKLYQIIANDKNITNKTNLKNKLYKEENLVNNNSSSQISSFNLYKDQDIQLGPTIKQSISVQKKKSSLQEYETKPVKKKPLKKKFVNVDLESSKRKLKGKYQDFEIY